MSVTQKARRTLLGLLALFFLLAGGIAYNVVIKDKPWAPGLGLDLAGGTEILMEPSHSDGSTVTASDLAQAIKVMRDRVDGVGVAEAAVTTQGQYLLISLPGIPDPKVVALVKTPANLVFRPVIYVEPNATGTPALSSLSSSTDPLASIALDTGSSYANITPQVLAAWDALDCSDPTQLKALSTKPFLETDAIVTCDEKADETGAFSKYVLGPVELLGGDVTKATSGPSTLQGGSVQNSYEVALSFSSSGATIFGDVTARLYAFSQAGDSTRNRFAMVLDGVVISAPGVSQGAIQGGQAVIHREQPPMLRAEAELLANELKYGSLPINLKEISDVAVTATMGKEQLNNGLLAGAIGLILVIFYSILQYRALALVTIGSLVIAGTLTFGSICVLSGLLGYRLSLAGVAGLIVSIGITADSFIIYFERVRDELREGRTLPAAVDHGWNRARRTIFASDAVSMLSAVVLYMTAVGNVRGFAFTLGLTTIIDLIVVTRFAHPVLILLARTRFFGEGHRFSGLDPRLLGQGLVYKGRGRVEIAGIPTLAERKAMSERGGR